MVVTKFLLWDSRLLLLKLKNRSEDVGFLNHSIWIMLLEFLYNEMSKKPMDWLVSVSMVNLNRI